MADTIISAVLNLLVNVAVEEGKKQVKLLTEFDGQVAKLRKNLETISTVLEDAEEKQVSDKLVKLWLDRLKEVSYDMEDVLDEWHTELLRPEAKRQQAPASSSRFTRKVRQLAGRCSPSKVVTRHDLAVKVKEIDARLDEVINDQVMSALTPKEIKSSRPERSEGTTSGKRTTTTFSVDVSKLHGRDKITETIMDYLCGEQASGSGCDLETFSVVGMGGLGKTALALKIYKGLVEQFFQQRIWVCVSDFFEETRVAKAIIAALEGLDPISVFTNFDNIPPQALFERISKQIQGKKFFLVLDDVWTEDDRDFESLKCTFKHGAPGSKILVTTRKDGVAKMMESSQVFHLPELSENDCWLVLSQAAFAGRRKEDHENLEDIGRQIASKCKGLPLAAKTLGSLLRGKKTRQEWRNVLNNEVWRLDLVQRDIFAPLLLSYYDLPPKVRRCLVYCAALPKDFLIYSGELINHWMAHGYSSSEDNPEIEEVGREYFNLLADRSFFQEFDYYPDGGINTCKMHDIVHDFTMYLAENEHITKHFGQNLGGDSALNLASDKKVRHVSVILAKGAHFPSSVVGTEKVRSIMTLTGTGGISSLALENMAKGSNRLRLLAFKWSLEDRSCSKMPEEIGKLVHLRHLDISSCTMLRELPEAICDLIKLIHLSVSSCPNFERLPEGIGKLINLRFLCTTASDKVTSYPKGVGKLTSLRGVRNIMVIADGDDPREFSLADLENLNQLRFIQMKLKGSGIEIGEARRAKFEEKTHLHELKMKLGGNFKQHEVIEALNDLVPSTVEPRICTDYYYRW